MAKAYIEKELALQAIKDSDFGDEYAAVIMIPPADVQAVVYCKDCEHRLCYLGSKRKVYYCEFTDTEVADKYYCASGQKAEEAKE